MKNTKSHKRKKALRCTLILKSMLYWKAIRKDCKIKILITHPFPPYFCIFILLWFFFPFFFLFNISPLPRDYHARPAKREIKLLQLFFLVISTNASISSHSLAPQMHWNKFEFHKSTGAPIRTYRPWAWLTAVKSGDVGSNLSMAATHLAISPILAHCNLYKSPNFWPFESLS